MRTNDGTDHQMNSQPENTADMEIAVNNKTDEGNSFLFLRCFVFFVLFFKVAVRTFTVTVRILRADKVLPVWVLSSEI